MAGHSSQKNVFHLPRSEVKPSEDLQHKMFPFIKAHELLRASTPGSHPTALAFLTLLKRLRTVILQDIAIHLHQGRKHSLFCMDVFNKPKFSEFKTTLLIRISKSRTNPASIVAGMQCINLNRLISIFSCIQKFLVISSLTAYQTLPGIWWSICYQHICSHSPPPNAHCPYICT
jgi:Centromere DNA-binding protein complex CBF3 subunit, domain 2